MFFMDQTVEVKGNRAKLHGPNVPIERWHAISKSVRLKHCIKK